MFEFMAGSRYPKALFGVNVGLACIDGVLAILAFLQLLRIHSRISHLGWTRQKVFHLLIGSSNLGYFIYFILTLVAAYKGWACWSYSCGFIFMVFPNILLFAEFLLLLSFWFWSACQGRSNPKLSLSPEQFSLESFTELKSFFNSNDDDDDDDGYSPQEALLEKTNKNQSDIQSGRKCCSFRATHVGSRQKVVILVTLLLFALMAASAILIWFGIGNVPVDSLLVARVYVDILAVAVLLLGGALACYGLVLFLKMNQVRSEMVSSEKWKVVGLAVVTVLCFTSSALVTIISEVPLLYDWRHQQINSIRTSLLLVLNYILGSSVPSAFLLWVMRELPPAIVINREEESTIIAFVSDSLVAVHPQRWTAAMSSQNQA